MPTTVILNGAWQNRNANGDAIVTIDATVGGVHHQARFLKADLATYTDATALRTYIALEFKATMRVGTLNQTRPGALWKKVRPTTREEDPNSKAEEALDQMEAEKRYPSVVHPAVIDTYMDGSLESVLKVVEGRAHRNLKAEEAAVIALLKQNVARR